MLSGDLTTPSRYSSPHLDYKKKASYKIQHPKLHRCKGLMEQNESPIYQWLSTVDNQEPSHQQKGGKLLSQERCIFQADRHAGEEQEQVIDTVIATGIQRIPRIALEVSDTMHGLGNSATRKRDADCLKQATALSTHETLLESESHKRSRYSYDPRPRYKTREDRYEYKGPSSAVGFQSQPRKGRAKKPRRRRHTMNDDFHAMNVTGNRLTVSLSLEILVAYYLFRLATQQHEPRYIQQRQNLFSKQPPRRYRVDHTQKGRAKLEASQRFCRSRSRFFQDEFPVPKE